VISKTKELRIELKSVFQKVMEYGDIFIGEYQELLRKYREEILSSGRKFDFKLEK